VHYSIYKYIPPNVRLPVHPLHLSHEFPSRSQKKGGDLARKVGACSTRHGTTPDDSKIVNGGWAANSTAWILEESKGRVSFEALLDQWISSPDLVHVTCPDRTVLALYFPRSSCIVADASSRPSHANAPYNWTWTSLYNRYIFFQLSPYLSARRHRPRERTKTQDLVMSCRASFTRRPMKRAY
jgi:hypothetical protein